VLDFQPIGADWDFLCCRKDRRNSRPTPARNALRNASANRMIICAAFPWGVPNQSGAAALPKATPNAMVEHRTRFSFCMFAAILPRSPANFHNSSIPANYLKIRCLFNLHTPVVFVLDFS
jgi:hypothetical protein